MNATKTELISPKFSSNFHFLLTFLGRVRTNILYFFIMKTVCVACESARALLGYVRARCARFSGWYVGAPSKRGVVFYFQKKELLFSSTLLRKHTRARLLRRFFFSLSKLILT